MSTAVSRGQALEVSARVATQVDWDQIDGSKIQNEVIQLTKEEFGRRFTLFLKNGCQLNINAPGVISIDRSRLFDSVIFIRKKGWKIRSEDTSALTITELDITKIVTQERIYEGSLYTRLDAKIAQTLFEQEGQVILRWMYQHFSVSRIAFHGTVFSAPDGCGYRLSLDRNSNGSWGWTLTLGC